MDQQCGRKSFADGLVAGLVARPLLFIDVQAVTLALARDGWDYDPKKVKVLQAMQVSTISIFNCLGRVVGGALSDFMRLRFGIKRVSTVSLGHRRDNVTTAGL